MPSSITDKNLPLSPHGVKGIAHPFDEESKELALAVGTNLRRLRVRRGLSLERLSQRSGVSRAMLCQIELGQSTPTIALLWKVARALEIGFSTLVTSREYTAPIVFQAEGARRLVDGNGQFTSRPLFPTNEPRQVEFHEIELAPRVRETRLAYPLGTTNNIVVTDGTICLEIEGNAYSLNRGDAIFFHSDSPHCIANPGPERAVGYMVVSFNDSPS